MAKAVPPQRQPHRPPLAASLFFIVAQAVQAKHPSRTASPDCITEWTRLKSLGLAEYHAQALDQDDDALRAALRTGDLARIRTVFEEHTIASASELINLLERR